MMTAITLEEVHIQAESVGKVLENLKRTIPWLLNRTIIDAMHNSDA